MFYFHTPHWGLNGIVGAVKSYDEEEKRNYVTSVRFDKPVTSALLHPVKYYYVYGRSNHCDLLYGQFGQKILGYHEANRLRFRLYCERELGLEHTLESLVEYMKKGEFEDYFIESVELEVNLKDLYRYKVLNQTFEEIIENRFNWSIKYYLETGNKDQKFTEYVGPFNEYRAQLGLEPQ